MKLNKKVEIGMNAITALRKRGGFVNAADIAIDVGTTVPFIEQIMRNLRVAGIVEVKRGPGGGYALNRDTALSAYSVAKAVGRFPDKIRSDGTLTSDLMINILAAFKNTKI